jgi:Surface antigen
MSKRITAIMIFILPLVAAQARAECNQESMGGGEIIGTLAGAAIGGLIGSQFGGGTGNKVAIGAGVVAGGFLGNRIGKALDCKDQQYHYETTQNALETQKTGHSSSWSNPDSGHSGKITPTRTYTSADGVPCREFTQTIYVDGKTEEVPGSACRQPDGTWQPVT